MKFVCKQIKICQCYKLSSSYEYYFQFLFAHFFIFFIHLPSAMPTSSRVKIISTLRHFISVVVLTTVFVTPFSVIVKVDVVFFTTFELMFFPRISSRAVALSLASACMKTSLSFYNNNA